MGSIEEVIHLKRPILADYGAGDDLPPTQERIRRIHHPILTPTVRPFFTDLLLVLTLRR